MIVSGIVATDRTGRIGDGLGMPWHLPRDLQRFRSLTMGKPILMGRKTFDSIGKPLPGRRNIVLTRNPAFAVDGVQVARSIDEALGIAERSGAGEASVIGGGVIFEATAGLWDRLHITVVDGDFHGETYFPVARVESGSWRPTFEKAWPADPKNPHPHRFLDLDRAVGTDFDLRGWIDGGVRAARVGIA